MLITYFRSSSYNTWDFCPQQYYLEYVLGLPDPSNKKADKGTIVHKALETLALEPDKYKTKTQVARLVRTIYNRYSKKFQHHEWVLTDLNDCTKWVRSAIEFDNGTFDPRKRNVVAAEPRFDFEIKQPWAKYHYVIDGKNTKGYLRLKGTIDLICEESPDTYEIIDWKTGRRFNWATDKPKTYASLQKDPQLLLYFYAAHHLYPDIKYFLVTIFYINDGGPFTITFDANDIAYVESLLKSRFKTILHTTRPKLNKSWKCNRLCHYGKNTFEDTSIAPITEFRPDRVCQVGDSMTQCEQIKFELEQRGIDNVTREYTYSDHEISKYRAPGS